jgi:hypothetical protein
MATYEEHWARFLQGHAGLDAQDAQELAQDIAARTNEKLRRAVEEGQADLAAREREDGE